jgi:hypothetical protein
MGTNTLAGAVIGFLLAGDRFDRCPALRTTATHHPPMTRKSTRSIDPGNQDEGYVSVMGRAGQTSLRGDATVSGVGVPCGVGVPERSARRAAEPVPLPLVVAVEAGGLGLGLHDHAAWHHHALGDLVTRQVGGGVRGGGAVAVAVAMTVTMAVLVLVLVTVVVFGIVGHGDDAFR